ncbi:MAG: hypothetical protein AAFY72_00765, partial [Cyanobacteria bacterium J06649_4]
DCCALMMSTSFCFWKTYFLERQSVRVEKSPEVIELYYRFLKPNAAQIQSELANRVTTECI